MYLPKTKQALIVCSEGNNSRSFISFIELGGYCIQKTNLPTTVLGTIQQIY